MHFIVNGTRYIISYKTTFANNFTNEKPAYHFNCNQSVDHGFLQHKQGCFVYNTTPTVL